jgi:hypothetical protein
VRVDVAASVFAVSRHAAARASAKRGAMSTSLQELRAEVDRQAGELDTLRDEWIREHALLPGCPPANADEAATFRMIRHTQAEHRGLSDWDAAVMRFRQDPAAYDRYRLAAMAPSDPPVRARMTPPFDPPFSVTPSSERFLAVIRHVMRRDGVPFDEAFAIAAREAPDVYHDYQQTGGVPVSE